jgi:hypothetical protein
MDYLKTVTYDQFFLMNFANQQRVHQRRNTPILDEKTKGYYFVVDQIRFNMYRDEHDDINTQAFQLPKDF